MKSYKAFLKNYEKDSHKYSQALGKLRKLSDSDGMQNWMNFILNTYLLKENITIRSQNESYFLRQQGYLTPRLPGTYCVW